MAKEAVPVAVAPACEQPNGVLPDFMDLPSSSMSHIPPEALARAFNLPQRRAEVPAYHPSWQWPAGGLDAALLMQQFQPASAYQAPGMMPMGAGLGGSAYPAYPYLGLNWLAMRDPAQIAMPPPSLPYYPCHMSAGAAQMPAAWPQRLPDKQAVLPGRVPPAVSPGWSAYPGGMPFPQGAACDMHGTPLQGLDYTGAGVANGQRREGNQPVQRARMVWTPELHQKFLDAVLKIGVEQAVPKKIMQAMDVDYLTRENVASHLQKYRLQLKREQEKGGRASSSQATPSCSATAPVGIKSHSGAVRSRSLQPKEPTAAVLPKPVKDLAPKRVPAHEAEARVTNKDGAVAAAVDKEQAAELQDTAASFRQAPMKLGGPSVAKGGSPSSGRDSPGSNTPLGEDKSGSGDLASGSGSPQSGSSRTMMQQRKTAE